MAFHKGVKHYLLYEFVMEVGTRCLGGYLGMGWIVRDDEGCFIAVKSRTCVGSFNVKEAKAVSIREALSWLKELDFGDVDVETDSSLCFMRYHLNLLILILVLLLMM